MKRFKVTYVDYVYADTAGEAIDKAASEITEMLMAEYATVEEFVGDEEVGGKG